MHKATVFLFALAFFVPTARSEAQFCFLGGRYIPYEEQIANSDVVLLCHVTDRYKRVNRQNHHPTIIQHVISDKLKRFKTDSSFNFDTRDRFQPGALILLMGSKSKQFPKDINWSYASVITAHEYRYFANIPAPDAPLEEEILYYLVHLASNHRHIANDAYHKLAEFQPSQVFQVIHQLSPESVRHHLKDKKPHQYHFFWYPLRLYTEGKREDFETLKKLVTESINIPTTEAQPLIAGLLLWSMERGTDWLESNYFDAQVQNFVGCYHTLEALSLIASLTDDNQTRTEINQIASRLLEIPEMTDLVVSELARWKEWDETQRLIEMYDHDKHLSETVKLSIIRYLLAYKSDQSDAPQISQSYIADADHTLKRIRENEPLLYKKAAMFFSLEQ